MATVRAKNSKEVADVKCPYFLKTDAGKSYNQVITCEGVLGAEYNTIRFKTKDQKQVYMEMHCNCYPNDCIICIGNDLKYDEDYQA